jgi:hypothetical protein
MERPVQYSPIHTFYIVSSSSSCAILVLSSSNSWHRLRNLSPPCCINLHRNRIRTHSERLVKPPLSPYSTAPSKTITSQTRSSSISGIHRYQTHLQHHNRVTNESIWVSCRYHHGASLISLTLVSAVLHIFLASGLT